MEEVLKHPLGPLPWSLANADGSMKKTNKASLARNLEKNVPPAENVPRGAAVIIDGMAIINKVNADKKTYGEIAETLFACILRDGYGCARIDIVFDVYNDISIKNAERSKRSSNASAMPLNTIMPGHKVQQWRSVLRCSASKTALIKFLYDEWQKPLYLAKLQAKIMYVTCQRYCVKISQDSVFEVQELETSQEEADTRIMLHAKHASFAYETVIIVSEDTDVIILALAFCREIGDLYIKCGTQTRVRYIDISKLGSFLGKEVCESLVGLHSFTGCDSVSAFSGKGKLSGLKLILKEKYYRDALSQLGKHWSLPPELFLCLQKFTCKLYASALNVTSVNDLRYRMFRSRKGEIESWQLPPCEDCLHLHALRSNYQAAIWQRCLEQNPDTPRPEEGHGWFIEDGLLSIQWMSGLPAPEAVLEFMSCKCGKVCELPRCECLSNGLKCTPACKLQNCGNMNDDDDDGDTMPLALDDDDDDDEASAPSSDDEEENIF